MTSKVLIADDEEVVRDSFFRTLNAGDYKVCTVADGISAVERARTESFDVAFLDLKMPGLNGLEVARDIHDIDSLTQIVVVTGYSTPEAVESATKLGISQFISKPITPDIINTLVSEAIARRASLLAVVADSKPAVIITPKVTVTLPAEKISPSLLRDIGLLISLPILSLLYVILFPFIGLFMLASALYKAANAAIEDSSPPNEGEGFTRLRILAMGPILGIILVMFIPLVAITKFSKFLAYSAYCWLKLLF